ncbi:MAG: hypothetical protein ABL953_07650 [Ilumatobacteraceae bacterium]
MKFQRIAIVSLVVAAAGLAGCSSTSKNGAASSSTSVVDTTVAGATTVPATAPPDTQPPAATNPPATNPPATQPPAGHELYDQVESPNVPGGHTDPFASSGVLGNGVYWVRYNGGETFTPDITVLQAYFGDECEAQAASAGDECLNGIFVPDDPSRDIADLPFANNVFLTVADGCDQLSYWITPDELREIRSGSPTVDDAPGCVYSSFAYLMTVDNGQITKFEQVWTP